MKTDVTIVNINFSKDILKDYKDYHIIDDNFHYEEILKYKKVLFFNVLTNVEDDKLEKLFKFLNDNNIQYINYSNSLDTCLYTKYLIIYDKDKILIEGNTMEVLKNDKLLKRIGLQLPFIVDLSILLKDYNLIQSIYTNKESLVGELWK